MVAHIDCGIACILAMRMDLAVNGSPDVDTPNHQWLDRHMKSCSDIKRAHHYKGEFKRRGVGRKFADGVGGIEGVSEGDRGEVLEGGEGSGDCRLDKYLIAARARKLYALRANNRQSGGLLT